MNADKRRWYKKPVRWRVGTTIYYSVVFTWHLPSVRSEILQGELGAEEHIVGGPAVKLMPDFLADIASYIPMPPQSPLSLHNKLATFTTRGCPSACPFCAVPKIEGQFRELIDWEPKNIICDNNLLAASRKHLDKVIDRLKALDWCDFNQGLEARRFDAHIAGRIAELKKPKVRFSCDGQADKSSVADAVDLARKAGLRDFGVYVLIGYKDSPEEALDRLRFVHSLGIRPNPMRFQPLDALQKNRHVAEGWTEDVLRDFVKYWSSLQFFEGVPFEEFSRTAFRRIPKKDKRQEELATDEYR